MIEKLVTSLEVSRKLKDLGIIQESCFYWARSGGPWHVKIADTNMLRCARNGNNYLISAFTVTELGMMLDLMTVDPDDDYISHCWPDNQAQMGIFDMLDDYRLPSGKLAFDGMIENLNKNLKEWRDK